MALSISPRENKAVANAAPIATTTKKISYRLPPLRLEVRNFQGVHALVAINRHACLLVLVLVELVHTLNELFLNFYGQGVEAAGLLKDLRGNGERQRGRGGAMRQRWHDSNWLWIAGSSVAAT